MNEKSLIGELFDGPIDVIGDVHGEIEALRALIHRLGYDERGKHPEDRRLVFVGDLGDRGEDSPGVIEWIRDRTLEGRGEAGAVLGNHDFNALDAASGGAMKPELSWLFDEARPYSFNGQLVPQVRARGQRRDDVLAFFNTLPLALERGGDFPVRVVHACWETVMVDRLRGRENVLGTYRSEQRSLDHTFDHVGQIDDLTRRLLHQNCNAVKRLTSGLEGRSRKAIVIHDEPRWELRLPWWNDYHDPILCIIGHYWRVQLASEGKFESLFDRLPLNVAHGAGPVVCIDYSVGKRFRERILYGAKVPFQSKLGALRLPEKQLFFDNDDTIYPFEDAPRRT